MTFPKPKKIRSKKITDSAKGENCTLRTPSCNGNSETVVFCHAPSKGKGMGTKSDDFWGAYGCSNCHQYVDNHNTWEVKVKYWLPAIYETQKRLFEKGLIEIT